MEKSCIVKTLKGIFASPGAISGKAFVVNDDQTDLSQMARNDILVIKYSTPMYFELFLKSSAILTEVGGITCHAAGLARELNKPCIVSVQGLLETIKTGDVITINANKGEVYCQY